MIARLLRRMFIDHPRTVGESYRQHFGVATRFGGTMIGGGIKAILHGIFPNIFQTAGSDAVRDLHAVLVRKRSDKRDSDAEINSVEWII